MKKMTKAIALAMVAVLPVVAAVAGLAVFLWR